MSQSPASHFAAPVPAAPVPATQATAHVDPPVCGACHHLAGEHDPTGALRFFCRYHGDYTHATSAACPAYVPAALT